MSNNALSDSQTPISNPPPTNRLLVKPKPGRSLATLHQALGVRVLKTFPAFGDLEIVSMPPSISRTALLAQYQQNDAVAYAELDRTVRAQAAPNDLYYLNGNLWHLNNVGQQNGIAGADIKALPAWDKQTSAAGIIVAVIDSGVRYTHHDLAENMWRNPNEILNGLDDDGNGYVDDIFGINAFADNSNPNDDYGHGTHVAGIIGARGNNGVGVAGICWQVQIMACRYQNSAGDGALSDAIECINYARSKGAKIINLSWGEPEYNSQALFDAINSARAAGIIVVCAAGNENRNLDVFPLYPASFTLDNIISVAATTRRDERAAFSSYGANSVDLGAPGDAIFSCWNGSDTDYNVLSGTSMSVPMVAGACALVWARYPNESYQQIIARVLNNVDPLPQLAGKCVTGGRLNLNKALGDFAPATLTVIANDATATVGTSDTASFTFTRVGNTSTDLTVQFQLSGSAIKWIDYRRPEGDMPESLTIPAGQSSATMTIVALTNSTGVQPHNLTVTLANHSTYLLGSPNNATATFLPAPTPFPVRITFQPPNSIRLEWPSAVGVNYQVQTRTSLQTGSWQLQGDTITANGNTTIWTQDTSNGNRFYRVVRIN